MSQPTLEQRRAAYKRAIRALLESKRFGPARVLTDRLRALNGEVPITYPSPVPNTLTELIGMRAALQAFKEDKS